MVEGQGHEDEGDNGQQRQHTFSHSLKTHSQSLLVRERSAYLCRDRLAAQVLASLRNVDRLGERLQG